MFAVNNYPITIAETQSFIRDAKKVFEEEEREGLIQFLALNPGVGDVIKGTGGVRKLRWPAKSQGKRGGARIIYYFRDLNMPVYLLALFVKGEKIDLTDQEKAMMSNLVDVLVAAHLGKTYEFLKSQSDQSA